MMRLIQTLSMMVTYQCNIACRHCGPFCDSHQTEWMSLDEIYDLIRQAADLGAQSVVLTGGEPTLLKNDLSGIFRFIHEEMNIGNSRIVSNARWAISYDRAKELLGAWQEAGLRELNFSCGEFHQEFVPIEYVANAYRAACDLGFRTVLLAGEFLANGVGRFTPESFARQVGAPIFHAETASPYSTRCHGLRVGYAMQEGRGKTEVPSEGIKRLPLDEIKSTCRDVNSVITVHPNGNTTACCGVMVREESLLNVGNWRETSLRAIAEAAHGDVILNWIQAVGLKDMKQWLESKDPTLKLRNEYQNICDLCSSIVFDQRCQKILIEHASEREPRIAAAKVAADVSRSPEFVY